MGGDRERVEGNRRGLKGERQRERERWVEGEGESVWRKRESGCREREREGCVRITGLQAS